MRRIIGQFGRFGVVGLVGFVVDVGLFNLLRATVLSPESDDLGPLAAKVVSVSVAICVNWIGNRYWTFRHERGERMLREAVQFAVVSVAGMLIALACLWVSHYVLEFRSALADNISANVVGLALGAVFRFWLYRAWVFAPRPGLSSASDAGRGDPALRPSERPVGPAGLAPRERVEAVPTVHDRAHRDE